jgi:hypothetical protein
MSGAAFQVDGPASSIYARELTGSTADDFIALVAADYPPQNDTIGDISNIVIESPNGNTNAGHALGIAGGASTKIRNITLRGVRGAYQIIFGLSDESAYTGTNNYTDADAILLDDVDATVPATRPDLLLNCSLGKNFAVRNWRTNNPGNGTPTMVITPGLAGTVLWDSILVDNYSRNNDNQYPFTGLIQIQSGATIKKLTTRNVTSIYNTSDTGTFQLLDVLSGGVVSDWLGDNLSLSYPVIGAGYGWQINVESGGTLGTWKISNSTINNQSFVMEGNGTIGKGIIANSQFTGNYWLLDAYGTTDLTLSGVQTVTPGGGLIRTNGNITLTIRGDGTYYDTSTAKAPIKVNSGTPTINIYNPDFFVDLTTTGLAKLSGGAAIHYSTAGTAAGTIPSGRRVVSDGTHWYDETNLLQLY